MEVGDHQTGHANSPRIRQAAEEKAAEGRQADGGRERADREVRGHSRRVQLGLGEEAGRG